MPESKLLKHFATKALEHHKTANSLQHMLGYIPPHHNFPLPPGFFHSRHWAIVFYNTCVQKIAKTKLPFEYPFTAANRPQNEKTLSDLRQFFAPSLQKGQNDDFCDYLGTNPAWNPACWPSGFPILHFAAENGCTALVYLILTEFVSAERSNLINFQRKGNGFTALNLAVYADQNEVEELLKEFHARDDIQMTEKNKDGSVTTETTKELRLKKSRKQDIADGFEIAGRGGTRTNPKANDPRKKEDQTPRSRHALPPIAKAKDKPPNPIHNHEPDAEGWQQVQPRRVKKEEYPAAKGPGTKRPPSGKRTDLSDLIEQLVW
jgi:hypothetical protein